MQSKKIRIKFLIILIMILFVAGLFPIASANFTSPACVCPFSGNITNPACICPFSGTIPNPACVCPFPGNITNMACICPFSGNITNMACICPFSGNITNPACVCPFSDESAGQSCANYQYSINSTPPNMQISTCQGASTVVSFSYSNSPLLIPEKSTVMAGHKQISQSTSII
jgi:hypothetical protein